MHVCVIFINCMKHIYVEFRDVFVVLNLVQQHKFWERKHFTQYEKRLGNGKRETKDTKWIFATLNQVLLRPSLKYNSSPL